jgi:hypothetical protein
MSGGTTPVPSQAEDSSSTRLNRHAAGPMVRRAHGNDRRFPLGIFCSAGYRADLGGARTALWLVQRAQNRDTKALHLKIEELLKATRGARNSMIELERLTDEQWPRLEKQFKALCGDEGDDLLERVAEEVEERARRMRRRERTTGRFQLMSRRGPVRG